MPTIDSDRALQTLDEGQCRQLLEGAHVGRLGFTRNALPAIQPVSFRVHGSEVVIPVRSESELLPRTGGAIVVLEADSYDETERTGWSVSVVGPSRLVPDPAEAAVYDALPWPRPSASPDRCYIAVGMTLVQGWRSVPVTASAFRGTAP